MKTLKRSKKTVIHCYIFVLLMLSCVLNGCTGRKAEFLAEISMVEEASEKEPEKSDKKASEADKKEAKSEEKKRERPAEIYVDVCGAVASPGVFQLKEGSRVFEAIEAAGGCLPGAALGGVNQAELLRDGQQIRIPTEEEMQGAALLQIPSAGAVVSGNTGPGENKVDINLAGEEELTTLTGIGATRARAIISYRETSGPFTSVEQIMEVEGIKEGTFAKIKDEIIVR